ncbi:unnamed protein product, partial [Oppiella nova]
MGITSVSIIMTVIVLNFHYRGPIKKEMPDWLKRLILNKQIYNQYYKNNQNSHIKGQNQSSSTWNTTSSSCPYSSHLYNTYSTYNSAKHSSQSSQLRPQLIRTATDALLREIVNERPVSYVDDHHIDTTLDCEVNPTLHTIGHRLMCDNIANNLSNSSNSANIGNQHIIRGMKSKVRRPTRPTRPTQATDHTKANTTETSPEMANQSSYEELTQILNYLLWRQEIEDNYNRMVHEWRLLALVIDKVLFWVFFVITLLSSLSFLVIIPIQRRGFPF